MRVADRMRYEVYKTNMSALKERIDKNQQMVASGKKILKPSDDPVATARSVEIGAEKNMNAQYKRNLDKLKLTGTFYDTSVSTISDLLTRAKEISVAQASDTMNADTRKSAATEVEGIFEQLVAVGNTKVAGSYIFGGKKSNVAPYASNGTFNGTVDVARVAVDAKNTEPAGISGKTIFESSTVNIFTVINNFKQHLENNDKAGIQNDLDKIGEALDLTSNNLAYVGTYAKKIDSMIDTNGITDTTLTTTESDLLDADTVQLIADYNTLSTAYQAALYTMSKVQEMSALNYLR